MRWLFILFIYLTSKRFQPNLIENWTFNIPKLANTIISRLSIIDLLNSFIVFLLHLFKIANSGQLFGLG